MQMQSLARRMCRYALPVIVGGLLGAFAMHIVHAQTTAVKRTALYKADLTGVDGKEVVMTLIEAAPGTEVPAHTHPGDEFLFVIEGSIDGFIEKTTNVVQAGGTFHAQRERVHGGVVTGTSPAKLLTVHVVDKGKPLATPATKP